MPEGVVMASWQIVDYKTNIMNKLTLDQIEDIYRNKPQYKVIYDTEDNKEVIQERGDIDKARHLFNSERGKHKNLRLIEITSGKITMVHREHEPIIIEEQQKRTTHKPHSCGILGGMSTEEYNQALNRFAALHGTTLENWGIKEL